MKNPRVFIFAILLFNFALNCDAQTSGGKSADKRGRALPGNNQNKIRETKPPEIAPDDDGDAATNVKIIAENFDSAVTTPFVFVARTQNEFAQMQKLVGNLPDQEIDFNRTAAIAAFAGTKNTGGYTLDVSASAGKISVKVVAPPKDAMTAQVVTAPYKIVLVNVAPDDDLNLDLSADFTKTAKNFRLISGKFQSSGGYTGARREFAARGTIQVLSFGENVTLAFDLTGKNKESGRRWKETVSGALAGGGKITLARAEAADFIERPHPFMTATGIMSKNKLTLAFAPGKRDSIASDGFAGGGRIEAEKIK